MYLKLHKFGNQTYNNFSSCDFWRPMISMKKREILFHRQKINLLFDKDIVGS